MIIPPLQQKFLPTQTTISLAVFGDYVKDGYLTCRRHPEADLLIWNYTPKTQFEGLWTEVTRMARGLITTGAGTIVARPFPKFFNLEEQEEALPDEPFSVTEKMDGSLGILYQVDGVPYLATRGSFTSEQALRGTQILHQRYRDFPFSPYYTYLFEIIYPQNRICVDYGEQEDLVLLAIIHTRTGEEQAIHNPLWGSYWPFPLVKHLAHISDIGALSHLAEKNKEGFVIRFTGGLRVKYKFPDYVRLHKILTQTTARTVWEYLKEGRSLGELQDRVPDEFSQWLKSITRELVGKFDALSNQSRAIYQDITTNASIPLMLSLGATISVKDLEILSRAMKKYIQEQFAQYPELMPILLACYDHRKKEDIRAMIWDSIRPAATRPFRLEAEGVPA